MSGAARSQARARATTRAARALMLAYRLVPSQRMRILKWFTFEAVEPRCCALTGIEHQQSHERTCPISARSRAGR